MKLNLVLTCIILAVSSAFALEIQVPTHCPQANFAKQNMQKVGSHLDLQIQMELDSALGEQAFTISAENGLLRIRGGAAGLMYGGLEVAERMRFGDSLNALNVKATPYVKRRGLSMDLPLDARSLGPDDFGTSARMNIEQVWSESFWHGLLDRMAEHRYNSLSLWCTHPFTTMLKLDAYPDAALNDVAIPTEELDEPMHPEERLRHLQAPENVKFIKTMPIEQKMLFWQQVMRYAKQRSIDLYFIIKEPQMNGSPTHEAEIQYLRESVKQFALTYPDLKGLGIAHSEQLQNEPTDDWLWKAYGQGIVDAKAEQPERQIPFIHHVARNGIKPRLETFISKYPDPVSVDFNYAKSRLYSVHNPSFFNNQLRSDCEQRNLPCWMNLRNDDIFNFRWADPDYVRLYMLFMPKEPTLAGYHMGSAGYVWGREFTSKEPRTPRQLEIDKHWYTFMLWGRLGYDPSLNREFFEKTLQVRFPKTDSPKLYATWQTASKIVPLINTWHWRGADHMWSVETCMSQKEGYHSVNHFIEFQPLLDQNMLSIDEFVRIPMAKGLSPFDVATSLDRLSLEVRAGTQLLKGKKSPSKELQQTLADLEAFAWLGHYYADKIRGSTDLHSFRVNGLQHHQKRAVNHLKAALIHWKAYANVASGLYQTQVLARTSNTDWNGTLLEHAEHDIEIARTAKHNEFPTSVMKKK